MTDIGESEKKAELEKKKQKQREDNAACRNRQAEETGAADGEQVIGIE